jgi:hypothetical protein
MAAYHKVEVSLNTNAVEVGIPSPQTVNVVVPTIGPAGPAGATGGTGATGAVGPQGPAGTGIETLTTAGDLLTRNDTQAIRLGIGDSGQILKVSSGGLPEWGAAPAQANQDLDTTDSPQFLGVFVGEGASEANQVGSVTITTQDGVALSMEDSSGGQVSMRWFSPATNDTGNHWGFGCDTLNSNANNFFIWDFINNRPALWANGDTGNLVLGNEYAEGSLPAKVQVIGISPSTATLLGLDNKTAGAIAMQIRAAASQSANLTEWLNSNGDVLASIDADGNISAPNFPTEVTDLAATGISADYVPVAQGDGTIVWEAQSGGGGGDTVSIQTTAADILSVSSGAISADDAGADRIVYWNNTSNKLTYGTPSDVGAAASSHTHGVADVTGAVASTDSRLSDSRTPTLHGSSHHTGGTDAIAPNNIGAAWALETRAHSFFSTSTYTLAQGRNVQLDVSLEANGVTGTITLPRLTTDSAQNGDDLFVRIANVPTNQTLVIQRYIWTGSSYLGSTETAVTATAQGAWRFRLLGGLWTLQPVANHTHTGSQVTVGTTANLPLKTGTNGVIEAGAFGTSTQALGVSSAGSSNDFSRADHVHAIPSAADIGAAASSHNHAASAITSGTLDVARLPVGTGSTQVAAGNHTHVAADVTGAAASGSITTSGLTQATARILGRTTASTGAVEEIQIGSGLSLSAGELSATGGSGGGEVRSDFVSPYTYTGLADAGTSNSTASWTIRRSEFDADGSFVATLTASAVAWNNRLTASYA